MDLTLLEVHVSDAEFNAPFSGAGSEESAEATEEEPDRGADTEGGVIATLLVLLGIAALAWYLRHREEGEKPEPDGE